MRLKKQKGFALITLIVAMVLMSALGVGIYTLTTSSTFSELLASRDYNAYQLAKAGARYAARLLADNPHYPDGTYIYYMPDANHSFTITIATTGGNRVITSVGRVNQNTLLAANRQLAFNIASSGSGPPANYAPPALTPLESTFTGNTDALDLTKSGDRVAIQGYIATGGTHAYWAAFKYLGEWNYRFEDPEEHDRYIGFHVAPIANDISNNLRDSWMQYHQLSYDAQVKNGWDLNKYSGGSGIAFRWHENPLFQGQTPPGNDPYRYYQGYGITYMIYKDDDDDHEHHHNSNDRIPNNIKPPGDSLNRRLLLVLWEQKVNDSGVPRKDWLAYAKLGDPSGDFLVPGRPTPPVNVPLRTPADPDQKVTGYQVWPDGRLNDNATIVVRVEDKFVTTEGVTTRYNDIKVFYGDASENNFQQDSRTKDSVATNKQRARYYPQWLETGNPGQNKPVINPQWPSNQFGLNGTGPPNWYNDLTSYDYFSLTSNAYNTVKWVINTHPRSDNYYTNGYPILLPDNSTIRTTDFVLDSFPSGRKELGLVGMGDISSYNLTVAFDDFYIQILGGY